MILLVVQSEPGVLIGFNEIRVFQRSTTPTCHHSNRWNIWHSQESII